MYNADTLRKFRRPLLPTKILHRQSHIKMLQDAIINTFPTEIATCKLVLLCAPAGYGKTTLLADFAANIITPCCWYLLEATDADILAFIQCLIVCIRYQFPDFGPQLDCIVNDLLSQNPSELKQIQFFKSFVNAFVAALQTDIQKHLVICLCHYHEINHNKMINQLLNQILHHLPSHCIIVIESRALPSLEMTSLLSHRQLLSIGSNTLRFSAQEILELASILDITSITTEQANELASSFDGWITGLLLGTRLGNDQIFLPSTTADISYGSHTLHMSQQNVFAYLVSEVFSRDSNTFDFLKATSILQYMTPELCNDLLSIKNAEEILTYAERQGWFITLNKDDRTQCMYYTNHPIMHKLLCSELCVREHERYIQLHLRAAHLFCAKNEYNQALEHAIAAQDYELSSQIIITMATIVPQLSQIETITHLLDRLPIDFVEQKEQLLLIKANGYILCGEWIKAQHIIEKAHSLAKKTIQGFEGELTVNSYAEILIAKSQVIFCTGDYMQARLLCQEALDILPTDKHELLARAHLHHGMSSSLMGECTVALKEIQQALLLVEHTTASYETAMLHTSLGNIYHMLYKYVLSKHHHNRAITICERIGDIRGRINNLIGLASVKRNEGKIDDALAMLQSILMQCREVNYPRGEAYTLEHLGEIYQMQDHFDKSLVALEDALILARQFGDSMIIDAALCELSITYLLMGDAQTALFLVEKNTIKTDTMASFEEIQYNQTRGTIFLHLHQYQEALDCLNVALNGIEKSELKGNYLTTIMRLAASYLGLKQMDVAICLMEQAAVFVEQNHQEHLSLIELRRLPELWQAIQSMPKQASLPIWRTQELVTTKRVEIYAQPSLTEVRKQSKSIRILTFGEPAVIVDDVPIMHWRITRSLELCLFLLYHHRPIRKELIIDALWHEVDENTGQALRSAVHYLRKAIGESCIVYRSGLYSLDLAAHYDNDVYYDVAVFQEKYEAVKKTLDCEEDNIVEDLMQEIVTLYRGDYLQPFYSNWCINERDKLRRIYIDILKQLALLNWRKEDVDQSIVHWQHLLAIDICLEEAHYGLMRCYMRQGKRNLALRQYRHCVDILCKELSVAPGSAIQKLYKRITGNI